MVIGNRCFVATACYGRGDHPDVAVLRVFRDTWLRDSSWGRAFVAWYYRHGPSLVRVIDALPGLRRVCRWGLALLVAGIRRLL